MVKSGGKETKFSNFCRVRGEKKALQTGKRFTIIMNPHKKRKGYIIMEIMSTNVTNTTTYCGENR